MFEWEWDARKAALNRAKHGVPFEEAATVFGDPHALEGPDLRHSAVESRFLRLGRAATGRVLIVAYTVRRRDDGESIRIISARRASREERAAYAKSGDCLLRHSGGVSRAAPSDEARRPAAPGDGGSPADRHPDRSPRARCCAARGQAARTWLSVAHQRAPGETRPAHAQRL